MLTIKVDTDYGPIENAATDACELAAKLGAGVEFSFNGIECFAYPHSLPGDIVIGYKKQVEIDARLRETDQAASEKSQKNFIDAFNASPKE